MEIFILYLRNRLECTGVELTQRKNNTNRMLCSSFLRKCPRNVVAFPSLPELRELELKEVIKKNLGFAEKWRLERIL